MWSSEAWQNNGLKRARSRHLCGCGHVDLALDLLAGPPSGINGAGTVFAALSCFSDEGGNPVVAEERSEFTVGERIGQITAAVEKCHKYLAARNCGTQGDKSWNVP